MEVIDKIKEHSEFLLIFGFSYLLKNVHESISIICLSLTAIYTAMKIYNELKTKKQSNEN